MSQILPDVRFGAGFLDKKYQQFAELGEVLMDKITGEMFMKRKTDGKIISFIQNKDFLHDIMIEMRILMKNHTDFTYPVSDSSWFSSSQFNISDILGTTTNLLKGGSLEFSDTALDEAKKIEFGLSTSCNGFFVRPISRATDKNIIEYLTNLYNINITTDGIENDNTNATLTYSYTVTGTSGDEELVQTYSSTQNVKINEDTFIEIPDDYKLMYDSITNIKVTIKMLKINKFSEVHNYMNSESDFDMTAYNDHISPDDSLVIEYLDILMFSDDIIDIPTNVNVTNVAVIPMSYFLKYMTKIDKLSVAGGYIPSETRPEDGIWTVNNVWGEIIKRVNGNGSTSETDHETDIDELEEFIYVTEGIVTNFTMNEEDEEDILIDEISDDTETTE